MNIDKGKWKKKKQNEERNFPQGVGTHRIILLSFRIKQIVENIKKFSSFFMSSVVAKCVEKGGKASPELTSLEVKKFWHQISFYRSTFFWRVFFTSFAFWNVEISYPCKIQMNEQARVIFFMDFFACFICVKSCGKKESECLDMQDNPWGLFSFRFCSRVHFILASCCFFL